MPECHFLQITAESHSKILDSWARDTHNMDTSSTVRALNRANSWRQVQQLTHSKEPAEGPKLRKFFPSTNLAAPPIADTVLYLKLSSNETETTQSLEGGNKKNCQLKYVLRVLNRLSIGKWMIDNAAEHGDKGVKTKALQQFYKFFWENSNENLILTSRCWKDRHKKFNRHQPNTRANQMSLQRATRTGIKKCFIKPQSGRGRERSLWVKTLQPLIVPEFDSLRNVGVHFDSRPLRQMAIESVTTCTDKKWGSTLLTLNPICQLHNTSNQRGSRNLCNETTLLAAQKQVNCFSTQRSWGPYIKRSLFVCAS